MQLLSPFGDKHAGIAGVVPHYQLHQMNSLARPGGNLARCKDFSSSSCSSGATCRMCGHLSLALVDQLGTACAKVAIVFPFSIT